MCARVSVRCSVLSLVRTPATSRCLANRKEPRLARKSFVANAMTSCSITTDTPTSLQILNATGHVLYSTATNSIFSMPWGGLSGTFPVLAVNDMTEGSALCGGGESNWAGKIILAGRFYGPGCSFETRARNSRNAAGLLFSGSLHNPFDWDGTAHEGLMPSAVANYAVYDCAKSAVLAAGGEATIEITSAQTPLMDAGFQAFSWVFNAPLLIMMWMNIAAAAWQLYRLGNHKVDLSTRAVVCLEATSQLMLFFRQLNGPGYAN